MTDFNSLVNPGTRSILRNECAVLLKNKSVTKVLIITFIKL